MNADRPCWYEFFAGGGMARLGLGSEWNCIFSNEWSVKKAASYVSKFGHHNLRVCDIAELTPEDLPGVPTLVWASFPCQDLSLAGGGAGLAGKRSGTFHVFADLMAQLAQRRRSPQIILLENVVGTLTSHDGRDFNEIVRALVVQGYNVGALVIDAVHFLPQSRPRLFFVAVASSSSLPAGLSQLVPARPWHTDSLCAAVEGLPTSLRQHWIWWRLPAPTSVVNRLSELIEDVPSGVRWHTREETARIINMMSPFNLQKLGRAQQIGTRVVGTIYRRTRPDPEGGGRLQRAEVRFDEISGCLRTPTGGSSRQTVIVVHGESVKTRLLSVREAARLMGVPDDYPLPHSYNDGYHLFGDGLAVPVVRWLSTELLTPLVSKGLRAAA